MGTGNRNSSRSLPKGVHPFLILTLPGPVHSYLLVGCRYSDILIHYSFPLDPGASPFMEIIYIALKTHFNVNITYTIPCYAY
jgi:hypothetical protein